MTPKLKTTISIYDKAIEQLHNSFDTEPLFVSTLPGKTNINRRRRR